MENIKISKIEENSSPNDLIEQIKEESLRWQALKIETRKEIVGLDNIVEKLLIGLLCNGHILLEGVPGLAKTTLVKAIAKSLGISFGRIQFTPDLLPADLVGTLIYNPKTQEFQTKKGPIFTNLVLADEINRAPAKVQSALLEAMQELQVTLGETSFKLDPPFLVLATQNPIEQEGTYRLPEAQLDRFMFKLIVNYPKPEEEKDIINKVFNPGSITQVLTKEDIELSKSLISQVYLDEKIVEYIVNIVISTRDPKDYGLDSLKNLIDYGASPRATLALHHASRAQAFLKKRHFVIPDDVKAVVFDVLRHRILLSYEAEAENITSDQVIQAILEKTPSP
ncbi:MoxR family ATPase [Candidatus Babeliales bacterium]|nr:MoxR family ATPase [Candidatus Babeliales bacterium]